MSGVRLSAIHEVWYIIYCQGTRCSCFKDTECSGPKSEICKRPEVFPSWPSKFHLTFEKKFIFDNDVWIDEESDKPKLLVGSIKQDLSMGKVLYIENGTNVLVQKENSSFVKVRISYNPVCTQRHILTFIRLCPDIMDVAHRHWNNVVCVQERKKRTFAEGIFAKGMIKFVVFPVFWILITPQA